MVDGKWQMVVPVRSRMRTRTVLAAVRAPRQQTGLARKHQRNAAVYSAITGHFRLPREKNRLQAAKVSHRARACAASHGPPGPCTLLGPGSYLRSGASDLTTPFAGGIGSYFHTPGLGHQHHDGNVDDDDTYDGNAGDGHDDQYDPNDASYIDEQHDNDQYDDQNDRNDY